MALTEERSSAALVDGAPPAHRSDQESGWPVSYVAGGIVVLFAVMIGVRVLDDNSFFTHLATGRLIADGDLPRSDPYTFTSGGASWVVQSWLASALYGVVDAVAGGFGLRVLMGTLTGVLGALVWRLSRPAVSLSVRVAIAGSALVVGTTMWSERPLLFGLIFMGLVLLVADGDVDPRWLVPVMFVWVNVHGSFPLALVALGALALGRKLDGEGWDRELAALKWAALGVVAGGVLNPYGPKLLLFPLALLEKSEVLQLIVEWRSPEFDRFWARVFLLMLVAAFVALARRPSYRAAVPVLVFVAAALLGVRNISVATLVLVPVLATAFGDIGSIRGDRRSDPVRLATLVLIVAIPVVALVSIKGPHFGEAGYPVAAVDWLEEQDLLGADFRMAHPDEVGNYLELRFGTAQPVFIDDRYELHDEELVGDFLTLLRGTAGWDEALDRWSIEAVLWEANSAIAEHLRLSDGWDPAYEDDAWALFTRAP